MPGEHKLINGRGQTRKLRENIIMKRSRTATWRYRGGLSGLAIWLRDVSLYQFKARGLR
jgi:hypothetical protein